MSATATRAPLSIGRSTDRAFYTGMAVAVIAAIYWGFARSYFLRGRYFTTPLAPIAKLHGAVFLAWVVLFLVQTVLITRQRRDLHRRLGIVGAVLAGVMVVVGTTIAVVSMRHNFAGSNERALSFFAIPIGDMLVFSILVASALAWRGQPETHKRLMLLATISLLDAAVARWPIAIMAKGPVAFFAVTDLFIAAGVVFDLASRGRVHRAYICGGLLIVGSQIGRLALWDTTAWHAFARMFAT